MEWLNYHHLLYFWTIVQAGSLTRAAEELRLTHSTLSTQLRSLEEFLGAPLFERRGRKLVLTPQGEEVAAYAADIFRMGTELVDVMRGRAPGKSTLLRVGVVGALPKSVTYRLLEPALSQNPMLSLQLVQDSYPRLLEGLAARRLHLVLAESPPPDGLSFRVHAHVLGETELLLYGAPSLAAQYRAGFPKSLQQAPFLVPTPGSRLRRMIEQWLRERDIRVHFVGEFDDSGHMRVFGAAGRGLFPVRAALAVEVEDAFGAEEVGKLEGLRERYYALSIERRVSHPAVTAVIDSARTRLLTPRPMIRKG